LGPEFGYPGKPEAFAETLRTVLDGDGQLSPPREQAASRVS
jgi:hypothetical protein